jgi:hypothetical protein
MLNNTIVKNMSNSLLYAGAGVYFHEDSPLVLNNIIASNQSVFGNGVQIENQKSSAVLSYNAIQDSGCNTECTDTLKGIFDPDSFLQWGPGNIDAATLFVDAEQGDFHLQSTPPSAAVDAGKPYNTHESEGFDYLDIKDDGLYSPEIDLIIRTNGYSPAEGELLMLHDLDLNPRLQGAHIDMGAYEAPSL